MAYFFFLSLVRIHASLKNAVSTCVLKKYAKKYKRISLTAQGRDTEDARVIQKYTFREDLI